jgi:glycosyltransferase involved in cell wall biosynthesis
MNNKLVSVLVCVYNAEKYIPKFIDNILEQTYSNIEIVFVDDASTDKSLEMLNQYSKKYDNIIVVESNKNGGLSAARNIGLEALNGDYFILVDVDDKLVPETIDEMVSRIEDTNAECVYCGYKVIYSDNRVVECCLKAEERVYEASEIANTLYDIWTLPNISCQGAKLYKTEILKLKRRTPDSMIYNSDTAFSFDALMVMDKISVINKNFYLYYQNAGSITYSYKKEAYKNIMPVRRIIKKFLLKHNAFERKRAQYSFDNFLLMQMVLSQELNCKNSYNDFKKAFKTIYDEPDTLDILKSIDVKKLSLKNKFGLFCIKHKLCLLLYAVWSFKKKIKK